MIQDGRVSSACTLTAVLVAEGLPGPWRQERQCQADQAALRSMSMKPAIASFPRPIVPTTIHATRGNRSNAP